jgi:hypothetical protein
MKPQLDKLSISLVIAVSLCLTGAIANYFWTFMWWIPHPGKLVGSAFVLLTLVLLPVIHQHAANRQTEESARQRVAEKEEMRRDPAVRAAEKDRLERAIGLTPKDQR